MKKERLAAFTDAVLAIIMTILVLELERPAEMTLSALWELRHSFFSYTLSFFWLGSMWISIHNEWETIDRVNTKILWINLVLLFFCSVIPYATDIVSKDFNNSTAQCFYGVFVILVTLANILLSKALEKENSSASDAPKMAGRRGLLWIDVGIKAVGFIIAAVAYPPAMMFSVTIAAAFLMIGRSVRKLN